MGKNSSVILIPILIFLLRWHLVSGEAGYAYSADPEGTGCGQNDTLPCDELDALRTVLESFESGSSFSRYNSILSNSIQATYCQKSMNTAIRCARDSNNTWHITEIDLSKNELTGFISESLKNLKNLEILRLWGNKLTGSIPKCQCLENLKNLKILDLSINNLDGPIPSSLGDLQNLTYLDLSSNNLDGPIPNSLGDLQNLTYLDLANNYLDSPIPSTLGDLQNLTFLRLRLNFLNGSIPASLGNLSSLQRLDLYSNKLSGPIPDELGNLTQLQYLLLDDNELDGTLPEAFGKLRNIRSLALTSNYFTGKIPQNYSYLKGLEYFLVAGNDLSGKIPDYIADWVNLRILNLLGNNFEGNLPEGIFKLTKLQTLWVSGLRNPGFTFPQEKLTTNLYSLILRNCSINDTIPSYIAQWYYLGDLDLSFNNLVGEIPNFTNPYLNKIFLARNKLSGTLPSWISKGTTNNVSFIDLSNNNFTSISSVNHENGTLSDSSNTIVIEPRSEYISQKSKGCKDKHRSLYINSGGDAVKLGNHDYEKDTAFSNFYISPQGNWAYSFSGEYNYISTSVNASVYIKNVICGLSLPETNLYVNARAAPVSLTYYAICLHQGKYNVELHFAETLYSKMEDHSKVGKRMFDVHIQEERVLQDFKIKEARGVNTNITKSFQTIVAKNKPLRIDFLWTGRGSMYNPPGQNGPLISAISITRVPRKLSTWEIVVIVVACVLGLLIGLLILLAIMWRMGWIGDRELREAKIVLETQAGKKSFTVKEIIGATGNFTRKIGKDGRFGIVYEAKLSNLTVAVKKLFPQSKEVAQIGTEVYATTFKLEHENLVQWLATYSRKDLHLLIYEYMGHGSLEQVLFDPKSSMQLSWETRYRICLQIAQGLEYLHAKKPPIIHRDIKANNILLDGSFNAKISDFGLAKLYEEEDPFNYIKESGTRMYMAPEYATCKAVTVAVDVFSFGVLLLEIVSGIKNDKNLSNIHDKTIFLLEKAATIYAMVKDAKLQYKKVKYAELVDTKLLNSNYSQEQVVTIIDLAMLCTNQMASLRPAISDVASVLKEEKTVEDVKNQVQGSSSV